MVKRWRTISTDVLIDPLHVLCYAVLSHAYAEDAVVSILVFLTPKEESMTTFIADQDLINQLRQKIDKATEIHQLVAKFKVHREDWLTVTVEVYDSGSGDHRFSCVAQA